VNRRGEPCSGPGEIREFTPGIPEEPRILAETGAYVVVYKPPFIHSVPLNKGPKRGFPGAEPAEKGENLLDWCASLFPEVRELRGRGKGGGGILHRLDYETRGLVLFARTQEALEDLARQQEVGLFIKEYEACSGGSLSCPPLPGFPPPPGKFSLEIFRRPARGFREGGASWVIESAFRPYGPGRQAVRPLVWPAGKYRRKGEYALDQGQPYRTEIRGWEDTGLYRRFFLGIKRGFRHQIRCHLSWIGFPLLNDGRYGGLVTPKPGHEGFLALRARSISFQDPLSRERREYRLRPDEELSDLRGQVEGTGP
jgi:23S rRNA pseudouridine1911/1915/1917 synthase